MLEVSVLSVKLNPTTRKYLDDGTTSPGHLVMTDGEQREDVVRSYIMFRIYNVPRAIGTPANLD